MPEEVVMSETQQEKAEALVEAFQMFDDPDDRYQFLIDLGRQLPPMPETEKTEANRIQECQNRAWVAFQPHPETSDRVLEFWADSDGTISKGLMAIAHRLYSGQTPEAILAYDIHTLLDRLGLSITVQRLRGLDGTVRRIKMVASGMAGSQTVRN